MNILPPIQSWESLHPLVVHFPIAILLIVPLVVIAGACLPPANRWVSGTALSLLILGTLAAWVAVATGDAAGELAERTPQAGIALERHEHLAELTRNVFTGLCLAFAALFSLTMVLRRWRWRRVWITVNVLFLIAYGAGTMLLANTAHQGAMLVHQFGIHALVAPTPPGQAISATAFQSEAHARNSVDAD